MMPLESNRMEPVPHVTRSTSGTGRFRPKTGVGMSEDAAGDRQGGAVLEYRQGGTGAPEPGVLLRRCQ
jgi:hypothetical protein